MEELTIVALSAVATLCEESALRLVLRLGLTVCSLAPPVQNRNLDLPEPLDQRAHRSKVDLARRRQPARRPRAAALVAATWRCEHCGLVELQEQVESTLADIKRGQVRKEVVAHEEAQKDEIIDQTLKPTIILITILIIILLVLILILVVAVVAIVGVLAAAIISVVACLAFALALALAFA